MWMSGDDVSEQEGVEVGIVVIVGEKFQPARAVAVEAERERWRGDEDKDEYYITLCALLVAVSHACMHASVRAHSQVESGDAGGQCAL